MDPKLQKWIDLAAEITAGNRWKHLSDQLMTIHARIAPDAKWWLKVTSSLAAQLSSEYLRLQQSYRDAVAEPTRLAWQARNLLEISVWCTYCMKSTDNSRRFYEDAGRDVKGIIDEFEKWGIAHSMDASWMECFRGVREDLARRAAEVGILSFDGSYERVHDAAKSCGLEAHFRMTYRFLSKFAHPTAMQIIGKADPAMRALQKDLFLSHVALFFAGGFSALEDRVVKGITLANAAG